MAAADSADRRSSAEFLSSRAGILTCGSLATLAGALLLVLLGAPLRAPLVNASTLLVALGVVAVASSTVDRHFEALATPLLLFAALLLMATACFGVEVEGAARWVRVGPILLQPGLVLVPSLLVIYAQRPTIGASTAMAAAALALALQPDRSLALALAFGLMILLMYRPEQPVLGALLAALAGVAGAFIQPDAVPPVEHVEGVIQAALAAGAPTAALAVGGIILLGVPGGAGALEGTRRAIPLRVFGATWLALMLAALLGPYPTPVLGYGSSAVLAYLLCSLFIRPPTQASSRTSFKPTDRNHRQPRH